MAFLSALRSRFCRPRVPNLLCIDVDALYCLCPLRQAVAVVYRMLPASRRILIRAVCAVLLFMPQQHISNTVLTKDSVEGSAR